MPRKHFWEEVVEAVTEQFKADLTMYLDYFQTDGRPLLQERLSPQDQLVRFLNPEMRTQIEAEIGNRFGLDAVTAYRRRMESRLENQASREV